MKFFPFLVLFFQAGEVRGGMAMLCGGGQLKLPDSILEGDMKKEGFLQKHGRRFGVSQP